MFIFVVALISRDSTSTIIIIFIFQDPESAEWLNNFIKLLHVSGYYKLIVSSQGLLIVSL